MTEFVVAYYIPHNDGCEQGIIDGPGFDIGDKLVDLYEVDGSIRSFATREEAEAWLVEIEDEKDPDPDDWGLDG